MSEPSTRTRLYPDLNNNTEIGFDPDTKTNTKNENSADDFYRDLHNLLDVEEKNKKYGKNDTKFCSRSANKNLYFLYATRLSPQSAKDFKKYRQILKASRFTSVSGLLFGSFYLFSSARDAEPYKPSWFTVMMGGLTLSTYFGSIGLELYALSCRPNVIRQEEMETAIEDAHDNG